MVAFILPKIRKQNPCISQVLLESSYAIKLQNYWLWVFSVLSSQNNFLYLFLQVLQHRFCHLKLNRVAQVKHQHCKVMLWLFLPSVLGYTRDILIFHKLLEFGVLLLKSRCADRH